MPSIRQVSKQDGRMFRDALRELSGTFEEQVLLKQWQSQGGGNPQHGVTNTDVFKSVHTRANISSLAAQEVFYSGSVFQVGDIKVELRVPIFGGTPRAGEDGQAAGRKPDQLVWRGITFYVIGRPERLQESGRVYWSATMRPVGA